MTDGSYIIKVAEGQTLFDIAIQEYGQADAIFLILEDNLDVDLAAALIAGQELVIRKRDVAEDEGEAPVLNADISKLMLMAVQELSCIELTDEATGITQSQFENCILPSRQSSEIISGLNNSTAQVRQDVAEAIGTYFQRTITYKAGATNYIVYSAKYTGVLKSIVTSNVTSYSIRKTDSSGNTATLTLPAAVTQGDVIIITDIVQTDTAVDSSFVLKGFYSNGIESFTVPQPSALGRYLFVLNAVDQTISVINTDIIKNATTHAAGLWDGLNPVVQTIALPAGYNFLTLCYRSVNKTIYVFGNSRCCIINADSSSGSFCNVYDLTGTTLNGTTSLSAGTQLGSCAYDFINDQIFISSTSGHPYVLNPATNTFTYFASKGTWFYTYVRYVYALTSIVGSGGATLTLTDTQKLTLTAGRASFVASYWGLEYNYKTGYFFSSNNGGCQVWKKDLSDFASIVNAAFGQVPLIYIPTLDLVIGANDTNNIGVINAANNTSTGTLAKGSPAANETTTRGLIYGKYSSRVYAQAGNTASATTGVNRIHVLNPGNVLGSMYLGYITVGNLYAGGTRVNPQMCFNENLI